MKKRLLVLNLLIFFAVGGFAQVSFLVDTSRSNLTICYGTIDTLTVLTADTNPPYRFAWRATGDTLSCDTCQITTFFATQNSTYIVTITDSDLVSTSDTIRVTVSGVNNVHITSSGVDTFCQGGSVILNTTFSATGYQWTLNGNNITGATGNSYTVADSSGNYQLTVTESGGCPGTSNTIDVLVNAGVSAIINPMGPVNICANNATPLQANAGVNYNYQWFLDGRPLPQDSGYAGITAALSGTYQVVVSNIANCSDTSNTVVVNINALPIVYFPAFSGDTFCNSSDPITLTGGNPEGGIYSGSGVTSDSIFNPGTAQAGANEITYTYIGPNNCSNTAFEIILVESCAGVDVIPSEDAVRLYPTPATGSVTLESEFFEGNNIYPVVYDVDGRLVKPAYLYDGSKIKMNTAKLSAGLYMIRISINGSTVSKRFIKAE